MHFRSLMIMGLCVALSVAVPAYAEAAGPAKSTELQKKKVAASKEKGAKAKLTAEERAAAKAKARAEAKAKAIEAKKTAMRDKAKADAQAAADAWTQRKGGKANAVAKADAKPVAEKPVAVVGLKQDDQPRKLTAERIAAQQAAAVGADVVVRSGNNGELRSADVVRRPSSGFFQVLFGDEQDETSQYSMLPETRALDNALRERQAKKSFRVNPMYEPQSVAFSGYPRGTIVIDTDNHFLYLVEGMGSARRYGIAVGREGLQFKGQVAVGDKQEWPRWIPTKDMQQREPKKYGRYKDGMPGGGQNPLGARAIYLYQGKQDTHLRIHGTIAPESIGTNSSNGCFRMINDHVIDLYSRVGVGTKVVIL